MTQRAPYCYVYPRPALTVDAAVFRREENEDPAGRWSVLLIRRGRPPFEGRWALPGGFVEMEESLDTAAARELAEETGITGVDLEQLHTFGNPGRDPRGRTVSVVYVGALDARAATNKSPEAGDDAAEAAWHPIDALPPTAFDHDQILTRAVEWLRARQPLCRTGK